jgi:glycolate oxidase FAD binding subunit
MSLFQPKTEAEAVEHVLSCYSLGQSLRLEGGATRQDFGRPIATTHVLSTKALSGVTLYEPSELVIRAKAGTPVAEIEKIIAAQGQMLPFEAMDLRLIYGTQGEPTLGGLTATGLSGPRRIQQGGVRDHLIGVNFINGRGELIKSGGRVMKNVTGLDLVKLSCAAHGTLGLLTELTFKLRPRPETQGTLLIKGLSDARGIEALCLAMGTPYEVSASAHLPAGIGEAFSRTLIRIENFASSVTYRLQQLTLLLKDFGSCEILDADVSAQLWRDISNVKFLSGAGDANASSLALWRMSVPPTQASHCMAQISNHLPISYYYDWSGGLIWLLVPLVHDAASHLIRPAVKSAQGHATLMRAPEGFRKTIDVFEPQSEAMMKLTASIKASLDPRGLFNPGRMYAEI